MKKQNLISNRKKTKFSAVRFLVIKNLVYDPIYNGFKLLYVWRTQLCVPFTHIITHNVGEWNWLQYCWVVLCIVRIATEEFFRVVHSPFSLVNVDDYRLPPNWSMLRGMSASSPSQCIRSTTTAMANSYWNEIDQINVIQSLHIIQIQKERRAKW